jgi:hypothetical protein
VFRRGIRGRLVRARGRRGGFVGRFGGRVRRLVRSAVNESGKRDFVRDGPGVGMFGAYSCRLQHFGQTRVVVYAGVESVDAGFEELHAGSEGGDAALEGC